MCIYKSIWNHYSRTHILRFKFSALAFNFLSLISPFLPDKMKRKKYNYFYGTFSNCVLCLADEASMCAYEYTNILFFLIFTFVTLLSLKFVSQMSHATQMCDQSHFRVVLCAKAAAEIPNSEAYTHPSFVPTLAYTNPPSLKSHFIAPLLFYLYTFSLNIPAKLNRFM